MGMTTVWRKTTEGTKVVRAVFKYCSKKEVQKLGLIKIPKSRLPIEEKRLDQLTKPELQELHRRQKAENERLEAEKAKVEAEKLKIEAEHGRRMQAARKEVARTSLQGSMKRTLGDVSEDELDAIEVKELKGAKRVKLEKEE
ncbi:hypothetical protein LTR66_017627 [Elasticomyces elasticus]|nr:hypothetical protein LTR66_017627 [Elasticomyces elasticus]